MALKTKRSISKFFIRADFDNQSDSCCLENHIFLTKSKPSKWHKGWNVVLFIICPGHFDEGLFSKPYYLAQMIVGLFCFVLVQVFFVFPVRISVWLFLFGFYRSRLKIQSLFNLFNLFLLLCFNCCYSCCCHLLIIFFLEILI